ncbi:hypothetical protein BDZ89DRAFT_1046004 [Hymenopellis radicata]|nr:hypothetical protein BDZ89DRAFT_1046004 [Hymenopellis radicata]
MSHPKEDGRKPLDRPRPTGQMAEFDPLRGGYHVEIVNKGMSGGPPKKKPHTRIFQLYSSSHKDKSASSPGACSVVASSTETPITIFDVGLDWTTLAERARPSRPASNPPTARERVFCRPPIWCIWVTCFVLTWKIVEYGERDGDTRRGEVEVIGRGVVSIIWVRWSPDSRPLTRRSVEVVLARMCSGVSSPGCLHELRAARRRAPLGFIFSETAGVLFLGASPLGFIFAGAPPALGASSRELLWVVMYIAGIL